MKSNWQVWLVAAILFIAYVALISVALVCPIINVQTADGVRVFSGIQISLGGSKGVAEEFTFQPLVEFALSPIVLSLATHLLAELPKKPIKAAACILGVLFAVGGGVYFLFLPKICCPSPLAGFTSEDISLSYVGIIVVCLHFFIALLIPLATVIFNKN